MSEENLRNSFWQVETQFSKASPLLRSNLLRASSSGSRNSGPSLPLFASLHTFHTCLMRRRPHSRLGGPQALSANRVNRKSTTNGFMLAWMNRNTMKPQLFTFHLCPFPRLINQQKNAETERKMDAFIRLLLTPRQRRSSPTSEHVEV